MPDHPIVDRQSFLQDFLWMQDRSMLESLCLDVDGAWWGEWQSKVEDGILQWTQARPNLIQFCMKCLNRRLQVQIQRILWGRLKLNAGNTRLVHSAHAAHPQIPLMLPDHLA